MWTNSQKTSDLVTFTEEILNGKLHFLRSAIQSHSIKECYTAKSLGSKPSVWNRSNIKKTVQYWKKKHIDRIQREHFERSNEKVENIEQTYLPR